MKAKTTIFTTTTTAVATALLPYVRHTNAQGRHLLPTSRPVRPTADTSAQAGPRTQRSSTQLDARHAERIEQRGRPAPSPCAACRRAHERCLVADGEKKCARCVRLKGRCTLNPHAQRRAAELRAHGVQASEACNRCRTSGAVCTVDPTGRTAPCLACEIEGASCRRRPPAPGPRSPGSQSQSSSATQPSSSENG